MKIGWHERGSRKYILGWYIYLIGKDDVSSIWEKFCGILSENIDKYVPFCKSKKREYPEWIARRVLKARK